VGRHDVQVAVDERDTGVRKIGRTTWRAGAVGLVMSGLLVGVFHNAAIQTAGRGSGAVSGHATSGASKNGASKDGASKSGTGHNGASKTGSGQSGSSTIVIPSQPPAPASGSGQVTSGAS
jgi:hypothetical protein